MPFSKLTKNLDLIISFVYLFVSTYLHGQNFHIGCQPSLGHGHFFDYVYEETPRQCELVKLAYNKTLQQGRKEAHGAMFRHQMGL